MKLFVDSANLADIEESLRRGFASGVTTNPSILAKEEKRDYREHIRDIIDLLNKFGNPIPLSVEVFTTDPDEMIRQSENFMQEFGHYKALNIKVPVGWEELRVISTLTDQGIPVNVTCGMSMNQAVMALNAGARYISLFLGRIRDIGHDGIAVIRDVRQIMDKANSKSEIIVGSIRHPMDINDAILAGAHIVTVPPKFFPQMCSHPKTTEAVDQFVNDFAAWMS